MRMLLLAVLFFAQRPSSLPVQTGNVTGRLLNADGSPAVKIRVSAMAMPESRNGNDTPALITLTETDDTGRYRLSDVPVGRYYIVAGFVDSPTYYPRGTGPAGATAISVTARMTTANIDFQLEKPSTGLTVSGRVIIESQNPGILQVMLNGGPAGSYTNLNVPAKLDGTFEFLRVRPGTYTVSISSSAFFQPRTILVSDKDVTGLELHVPWTGEVTGRTIVDAGDPAPPFQVGFNGANRQTSAQGNQGFRAVLTEGFYGVTALGVPAGFYVKSITSGSTNLLTDPLRVSRTSMPPEIVVTLGVSTPTPWVKVSGRVTGTRADLTNVTLNGLSGSLQSALGANGSFNFPKVLPGVYTVTTNVYSPGLQPVTLVVPNRDLSGFELALPVTKEISGRILIEDGGPLPRPILLMTALSDNKASANEPTPTVAPTLAQVLVTVNARPGPTSLNLNIQPDGRFKATVPVGQYQMSVNVPSNAGASPYQLKTFTYGTTDLTRDPIKITSTDSAEMQITFAPMAPSSLVKVSGRVIGLNPTPTAPTVTLNSPAFAAPLTAPVRSDGTFQFAKVYTGTYQVRVSAGMLAAPTLDLHVGNTDVTDFDIVVPRQKEVSGRIILEGRGPMPQLSFPLMSLTSPGSNYAPTSVVAINPQADGTFRLTLPEGERQVGRPNGLPPGYTLKSLFYGSTDLSSAPLRIAVGDTSDLRLTLSTPDMTPVKVSGKVSGLEANAFGRSSVIVNLNSPGYAVGLQAAVATDGSFEFPAVFPGNYSARLTPIVANSNVSMVNVVVGSTDVTGVEIVVPRQKQISGRITLEGRGPMPQFGIQMTVGSSNSSSSFSIYMAINPQPDGTFRLTVPEGERRAATPGNLPAGYALKSISYGSTDLMASPMKVSVSDTAELHITISTPDLPPVKVSGKVSAYSAARGPLRVNLTAPGYAGSLQATVASDGSFNFSEVFPGNYSARVTPQQSVIAEGDRGGPALFGSVPLIVDKQDITNLEIPLVR